MQETPTLPEDETPARLTRADRIDVKKKAAKTLQALGMSRTEARAHVFGEGRRTIHPTRRTELSRRIGINAAAKRRRRFRAQSVAASVAVAEASY